jgi:hypothetical protein
MRYHRFPEKEVPEVEVRRGRLPNFLDCSNDLV